MNSLVNFTPWSYHVHTMFNMHIFVEQLCFVIRFSGWQEDFRALASCLVLTEFTFLPMMNKFKGGSIHLPFIVNTFHLSNHVLFYILMQDDEKEVLKRDVSGATLEDHFDKTVLPKVMQVMEVYSGFFLQVINQWQSLKSYNNSHTQPRNKHTVPNLGGGGGGCFTKILSQT